MDSRERVEFQAAIQRKDAELEERGRLLYKSKVAIEQLQSELEAAQRGEDEAKEAAQKAEEERDAALKLAEQGGAQGAGRAARFSQLEDQLSTGAQREGVLQSQLADALQQCADQEKWLEEQKADIVDLEVQLTSAQAQAAELQERLADADTSHIDQGRLQDQQVAELKELRAQLSSTQSHQTRLRAQLYEARQAASAQAVTASKLQDDLGIVKDLNMQLQAQLSAAQSAASEQEHDAMEQAKLQTTLKQQLSDRERGLADADAQLKQMQQDRERWERTFRELGQQAQGAASEKQAALAQLKDAEAAKEKLQEQLWAERQSSQQLRQHDATSASSHQQQLEAARKDGLAKAAAAEASAELHIQALSHEHQAEKAALEREWRQKVADGATEALAAAAKQRAEERADWDRARCQLEERWTASLKDLEAKAADQAASNEAHTAQDVRALEKKWRRKVKEARAEKESLRSELAGRLALLADRMTQLASKEARHETRQVDLAKAVDELRSAGQGESRRRWELEGALREAATIFKRELCDKNETLRTLQSELRHMRKWHARALEGLPNGGGAAWAHLGAIPHQSYGDPWLTLPAGPSSSPWQANSVSSPAQPGGFTQTTGHGAGAPWAASVTLDPATAPQHPAHLPTSITTPGTHPPSSGMHMGGCFASAQPSPPAFSDFPQQASSVQAPAMPFPQPSFASPAQSIAASPSLHNQSLTAPQPSMQQSPGSSPSRTQGVQNFNAQPPGPSRNLSAQLSQPFDNGLVHQHSIPAGQPQAGHASSTSPANRQQLSSQQFQESGGQAGPVASANPASGRAQAGVAHYSQQGSLSRQSTGLNQSSPLLIRNQSGMSQQGASSRRGTVGQQPSAHELNYQDRPEAVANPSPVPSKSADQAGSAAKAAAQSDAWSQSGLSHQPSHSENHPAQRFSSIGETTFRQPGSAGLSRGPTRHQSMPATDRGVASHSPVPRRDSLFDVSPGPMLTYPVVPLDAVDMATCDTSAMLETEHDGAQESWQGFASPQKQKQQQQQQQQQQTGEVGWLQRTSAAPLLESPRQSQQGRSRSTGSTEASFRMHEPADHADATPEPLSAQHSRLDAQHLSRPAAGSMQQSSSDDGSSIHQHPAQSRSVNAHLRNSESRPGAPSASTRPMTGSIRSSGTLRDSLEDQLRSLQAQYDRVLEQERAIDAAAEQSLSRNPSTQAQTLIRAHHSGEHVREGLINLAAPSKQQSARSGMPMLEPASQKQSLEPSFGSAAWEAAY